MLKLSLFAYIFFALYISANTEVPSFRISGGIDADIEEFPYQVSIRDTRFKLPHICGGFIYKLNVVITAANCIVKRPPSTLKVNYGSDTLTNISGIIIHPEYDDQMRINDIAVLFLQTPIPMSPTSKPIEIARLDEIAKHNQKGIVAGWGCKQSKKCFNQRIQSLKVTVVPDVVCEKYLGKLQNMICAVSPRDSLGTCYGDNGNPLVIELRGRRKVIGVVSFIGPKSLCAGDNPTVYTKVPVFSDWIKTFVP